MQYAILGLLCGVIAYFFWRSQAIKKSPVTSILGHAPQVQNQAKLLSLMNEIDRAVLSNASFERICELMCTQLHQYIPYQWVAISTFEKHTTPSTVLTMLDGQTSYLPIQFEPALKARLDSQPNGYLLEQMQAYESLKPFEGLGASCMLMLPIYRDAELSALLSFGFADVAHANNEVRSASSYFADRLGVVVTSVFRAKQLFYQEHYDTMTGLPNRRSCHQRLSLEISRAHRNNLILGVMYISLNGFKKVNDIAGYMGGDAVLQQVAERLRSHLREPDLVSRFGGDEFVLVLTDIDGLVNIGKVAQKILDLLAQPFMYDELQFYLTATIGISVYPNDGQAIDLLLRNADTAMSRIKTKDSGSFIFYEETMNSAMIERLNLERDLRQAFVNQEVFLMYQPQLDLRSKRISGVEVLIRWKHPKRGVISPMQFIHIAEESEVIEQLGGFVRKTACEQLAVWQSKGLLIPKVAINVSSKELKNTGFEASFNAVLQSTGVNPSLIELEITESLLIEEEGQLNAMLRRLRANGVQIAIDDFGTGYSSLSYLAKLPFDVLKIDRAFIQAIGRPSESHEIVSVMINIAHHFGKKVCAEGVETQQQLQFLKENGCESMQGFLLSEPLSAPDFEQFFVKHQHQPVQLSSVT